MIKLFVIYLVFGAVVNLLRLGTVIPKIKAALSDRDPKAALRIFLVDWLAWPKHLYDMARKDA